MEVVAGRDPDDWRNDKFNYSYVGHAAGLGAAINDLLHEVQRRKLAVSDDQGCTTFRMPLENPTLYGLSDDVTWVGFARAAYLASGLYIVHFCGGAEWGQERLGGYRIFDDSAYFIIRNGSGEESEEIGLQPAKLKELAADSKDGLAVFPD